MSFKNEFNIPPKTLYLLLKSDITRPKMESFCKKLALVLKIGHWNTFCSSAETVPSTANVRFPIFFMCKLFCFRVWFALTKTILLWISDVQYQTMWEMANFSAPLFWFWIYSPYSVNVIWEIKMKIILSCKSLKNWLSKVVSTAPLGALGSLWWVLQCTLEIGGGICNNLGVHGLTGRGDLHFFLLTILP